MRKYKYFYIPGIIFLVINLPTVPTTVTKCMLMSNEDVLEKYGSLFKI